MSQDSLNRNGLVTVEYIVANIMSEIEDYTDRQWERVTQFVIRGIIDMSLFHRQTVQVAYFNMDSSGVVDISSLTDYVKYTKVGIVSGGKIYILGVNDMIPLVNSSVPSEIEEQVFNYDEEVDTSLHSWETLYFAPHYVNGIFTGGLYGLSGGWSRSFFREDKENQLFQFDTSVPNNQVIIEYISTGVKADGSTLVPINSMEMLIAFGKWKIYDNDPTANEAKIRRAERHFYDEESRFRAFENSFTIEEFIQAVSSGYKATPKR